MIDDPAYTLLVKKLVPQATLPKRAHDTDAGFDLFVVEDVVIPPGEVVKAKTGVAIQLPEGYWGLIKERSSVALRDHVMTLAGVVDNGYRGEIILALFNTDQAMWVRYPAGDKVAQIIPIPMVKTPEGLYYGGHSIMVKEVSELDESTRGHGGFGSTGS